MSNLTISKTNIIIIFLFISNAILWTPVLFLLLDNSILLNLLNLILLSIVSFFLYLKRKNYYDSFYNRLIILYFISVAITTIYVSYKTTLNLFYLKRTIWFALSLFIISRLNLKEISYFVKIYSLFIILLLLFGFIALIYSFLGGSPILSLPYHNTYVSLYLSSFTIGHKFGNLIRVSGIYDEPGTLSFVIWVNILLRNNLNFEKSITKWIVIFSNITFSLIGFILTIIYFFHEFVDTSSFYKRMKFFLFFLIFVNVVFIAKNSFESVNLFLNRFSYNEQTGTLNGDNRTAEVMNFLRIFDAKIFLWGNYDFVKNKEFYEKIYGNISADPFTPIYLNGIIISWIYYYFLGVLLFRSIIKRDIYTFILFLLILQRPFLLNSGYSFLILLSYKVIANREDIQNSLYAYV